VAGCTSANATGCNSNGVWFEEGGPLAWGSGSGAGIGLVNVYTGQSIGIYVDDTVTCPTSTPQLVAPTSQDYTVGSSVCEQEWVSYYANLLTPPPILYAGAWWDSSQPLVGATATLGEMYTQTGQTACTTSSCGTFACSPYAGYGYIVQRYLDFINSTNGSSVFYPSGSQYPWFTNLWATAANCVQNNGVVAWY
jgi:hypothetical protein